MNLSRAFPLHVAFSMFASCLQAPGQHYMVHHVCTSRSRLLSCTRLALPPQLCTATTYFPSALTSQTSRVLGLSAYCTERCPRTASLPSKWTCASTAQLRHSKYPGFQPSGTVATSSHSSPLICRALHRDNHQSNSQADPASASSFLKMLFTIAAGTLVLVGFVLALLPSYLSTSSGTRAACKAVSNVLPGHVEIARISTGWLQPTAVEGLIIYEREPGSSRRLVEVEKITTAGGSRVYRLHPS